MVTSSMINSKARVNSRGADTSTTTVIGKRAKERAKVQWCTGRHRSTSAALSMARRTAKELLNTTMAIITLAAG